jgi:toxin ParE1/3/4
MHAIHWKKQAINDLIKIGLYIARDSPASAEKITQPNSGRTPLPNSTTTACAGSPAGTRSG